MDSKIKIGCCGFSMTRKKYYTIYKAVELQDTFYTIKKPEYYEKLRKEAHQEFEFVIKASQLITHPSTSPTYRKLNIKLKNLENYGYFKPTKEVMDIWNYTLQIATSLKSSMILFQSPATFKPSSENLKSIQEFFEKIERKNLILGWEPRGEWREEEIEKICNKLDLIDVVDPFLRKSTYTPKIYYRIHGGKGYRKSYSIEELTPLVQEVKDKEGYIFFNNLSRVKDSQVFIELLASA